MPDLSDYEQVDELLKSSSVLPGDTISYRSNNQQGAWSGKVVIRGNNKKLGPKKYLYNDYSFFGKKGDAEKAMKIMWKEGITLKQAWKRVKAGKKGSPKKRKGMSPKKKKAVANAKKAMKLKWKEGITLKQAWKKVNKFGDTVCPPGFEPNAMWTGKSGQLQCIKMCGPGMYRDPTTNRCRKMQVPVAARQVPDGMEINPATGRLRKVCLPPNMRNDRGRCVKPKAPVVLKPGYEINPATGRQRKMCLPGQYRDPMSGRCRTIKDFSVQPLLIDAPVPNAEPLLMDAPVPIMEPLLGDYRAAGGLVDFGKRYKFGNSRKCGFGTCRACTGR